MLFIAFAATTLCAAMATRLAIAWALGRNLLDHPNHRSSHSRPTPRGGGVAIVLAFYLGLGGGWIAGILDGNSLAVLLCGMPVAAIGYLDDLRSVSIRSRIAIQSGCAAAALSLLAPLPELALGQWTAPTWLAALLYGLALVWLTNLYNFMDGIDAMAAGQAVVIGALWTVFLPWQDALPAVIFAAAALGFLAYNWPPARIFMGDVGSGFCGFIAGLLTLLFASRTQSSPLMWLMPLTVFACDATITLLVRSLRGCRPGTAHCSHVYQRLARRAGRHLPISVGYMLATALITGPSLGWALRHPEHQGLALAACTLPLIFATFLLKGGHDD